MSEWDEINKQFNVRYQKMVDIKELNGDIHEIAMETGVNGTINIIVLRDDGKTTNAFLVHGKKDNVEEFIRRAKCNVYKDGTYHIPKPDQFKECILMQGLYKKMNKNSFF